MKITNIKLTPQQISGNEEGAGLLLNVAPGYDYVDGKKTTVQSHIKYEVVFPTNSFEKAIVKVPGTDSVITEEMIVKQGGNIKVKFKNLSGKFYRMNNGEYALSCNADSLEVMK